MSILLDVENALKTAMRGKDQLALAVLRMLKSNLKNKLIELQKEELTDDEVLAGIKSEVKKRKDSIEVYKVGGRPELAEQEENEIAILQKFLPEQLSGDVIKQKAQEVIERLSEEEQQNFGKAMSAVMAEFKGSADGGQVRACVKEIVELLQENKN